MKINLLILSLLIVFLKSEDVFYLSLDKLISGNGLYELSLINRKNGVSDNDLYYSGTAEYMENVITKKYNKIDRLKTEKHPLLFMFDTCLFEYINYFPRDSIFVIDQKCVNYKNTKKLIFILN